MTKLMEWLTAISALISLWVALLTNKIGNDFTKQHHQFILYLPIILIILFGLYALTVVLYRTFTFNNCEEAAAALKKEIQEAKSSLKAMGYIFPEKAS
ncbi:dolichol-phosphate mannosyltransferase subunit 3 [Coccinella septempunctata]|uniref:dolichol-phosphate mannosyltransferase subunit 3 n=1 Tax=Coccinella septempunctata TaxID=41139 RepID=UPI001D08B090|nr:dolichol-phosphate mannosyltransferase subunit 3 [Coccinella septempunctata]